MTKDERIRQLEDEVMVLKDALGLTYKGNPDWALTDTQTQILGVLSKTVLATNERIYTAVWGMKPERDAQNVKIQIFKLRNKLAPHGIIIETKHGIGYALSPESRAIVRASA